MFQCTHENRWCLHTAVESNGYFLDNNSGNRACPRGTNKTLLMYTRSTVVSRGFSGSPVYSCRVILLLHWLTRARCSEVGSYLNSIHSNNVHKDK
jgi:hypothetical protein